MSFEPVEGSTDGQVDGLGGTDVDVAREVDAVVARIVGESRLLEVVSSGERGLLIGTSADAGEDKRFILDLFLPIFLGGPETGG